MFNTSEYLGSAYDEAEETAEVTTTSATEDTTSTTEDTSTTTEDTSTTGETTATENTAATTVAAATNYVSGSTGNKSLDALLGIQSSTSTTSNAFMNAVTNAGVNTTTAAVATDTVSTAAANNTVSTAPPAADYIYTGGNQVISNYTSGASILLGAEPTGAVFADGNFYLGTASGTLVIQNAANKVIDFEDANANDIAKAYKATTAGVIDGRGLDGFEVIEGSDAGADLIFAGSDGSSMYGGYGSASDSLIGGAGTDIFISGKYQGYDVIGNAETKDIINVADATLSDIVATNEQNGIIAVSFNNGNVIAVSSAQSLSAAFMLADGSAWRFNHATKSWQSA